MSQIITVIFINLLLTGLNVFIVFQLLKYGKLLKTSRRILTEVEDDVYHFLISAPDAIFKTQKGTKGLRNTRDKVSQQWKQLRSIFRLIGFFSRLFDRKISP